MGTSSGLGSGALGFLLHLGQLLSACLPSLLHGHWSECAGNWSVFRWCFCSGGTLTVFMVELCGRQSHFPLSCYDVLYHCAFYFTLFCLCLHYFHHQLCSVLASEPHPEPGHRRHCLLLHQAWTCALAGDTPCFVPAGPAVLGSLLVFLLMSFWL